MVLAGKYMVHEHAGKRRNDDADPGSKQTCNNDKGKGSACTRQPLFGKVPDAPGLAGRHKVIRFFEAKDNSCKRPVKLIKGDLDCSAGGVIDYRFILLKSVQHNKVIEIPMNYRRKGDLPQILGFHAVCVGSQTVGSGRNQQITGIAAVPGNTAVRTKLLQGQPFSMKG